ncbi:MAG: hypothetical protein Q7R73_00885 [bacterium]|nr:hypothetical protein [bacterium]
MKKIACVTLALGIMFVSRGVFAEERPPILQNPEKDTPTIERTEQKPEQTIIKRVAINEDGTITIYYEGSDNAPSQ